MVFGILIICTQDWEFFVWMIHFNINLDFIKLVCKIDNIEYHALIISNLICSAFWNTLKKIEKDLDDDNGIFISFLIGVSIIILILLALIFPFYINIGITIFWGVLIFLVTLAEENYHDINQKLERIQLIHIQFTKEIKLTSKILKKELKNIIILTVTIIVLNYMIYKIL